LGFAIEGLRDGGWAANFTEKKDLYFEVPATGAHAQQISNAYLTGWFGGLAIRLDPSKVAGACS
jgi:hypothetical protein